MEQTEHMWIFASDSKQCFSNLIQNNYIMSQSQTPMSQSKSSKEKNGKFKGKPEEKDNQLRLDKIDVYYQEAGTMRFVPRACLVDLESSIMDVIKATPMGALFK
eukprot:553129_1